MSAQGAEREFERLFLATAQDLQSARCRASLQNENLAKNRYANVLPFDENRVKLSEWRKDPAAPGPVAGDGSSDESSDGENGVACVAGDDYINASLLSDSNPPELGGGQAYIATQGPKDNTVDDFWRMIWQEKARVIVMLGKHIEQNVLKFHQYWPLTDNDVLNLEVGLQVSVAQTVDHGPFVERTYTLSKGKRQRTVTHLMFVEFPDHGVPDDASHFNWLIEMAHMRNESSPLAPPIVVHCSAGLGRTGVFIAASVALRRALLGQASCTEIQDLMLHLRRQRAGLIQTKEQVLFVYLCVLSKLVPAFVDVEYSTKPYFHPDLLDEKEVEVVLRERGEGSFLFRPGDAAVSDAEGGDAIAAIVLSYADSDDVVYNVDIEVVPEGFIPADDGVLFHSLEELMTGRKDVLVEPIFRGEKP